MSRPSYFGIAHLVAGFVAGVGVCTAARIQHRRRFHPSVLSMNDLSALQHDQRKGCQTRWSGEQVDAEVSRRIANAAL